jgi:hypothetical protein
MNKLFKRQTLLIIAIALVVFRFAVMPLLEWQNAALKNIELKQIKLDKLIEVDKNRDMYLSQSQQSIKQLEERASYLQQYDARTKIRIQETLEQVFLDHDMSIESFRWLPESAEKVRRLRPTIRFKGKYSDFLRAIWVISKGPYANHQFQWNYSFKIPRGVDKLNGFNLLSVRGEMAFEFFAADIEDFSIPNSAADSSYQQNVLR